MKNSHNSRLLSVVALCVSVLALSIGFAAFNNTLTIDFDDTVVTTDESKFNVKLSTTMYQQIAGDVVPVTNPEDDEEVKGSRATISLEDAPTISGLGAEFTMPGQSVEYNFYAVNMGDYVAYLKKVIFGNSSETIGSEDIGAGSGFKVCKAVDENVTPELLEAACNSINVTVTVGDETYTVNSNQTISEHSLAKKAIISGELKGGTEDVKVVIKYADDGAVADGDFKVYFGNITLKYLSADINE